MKKSQVTGVCVLAAAVLLLLAGARVADAVTCDPTELSPCIPAISSSVAPTSSCCQKLKAQTPCLCGYLKDPNLQTYIPGAKRVAAACGVAIPTC